MEGPGLQQSDLPYVTQLDMGRAQDPRMQDSVLHHLKHTVGTP